MTFAMKKTKNKRKTKKYIRKKIDRHTEFFVGSSKSNRPPFTKIQASVSLAVVMSRRCRRASRRFVGRTRRSGRSSVLIVEKQLLTVG